MVNEQELVELFSDIAEDEERSFGDRLKAAEFLMKYHFSKNDDGKEDRVVIIDNISERIESDG